MSNLKLNVPREFRHEGKADNEVESVASGSDLIQLECHNPDKANLAPHDYVGMLQVLRRYIRPEGRIFFSVFVNEVTDAGHGF
jgi:hypothetical protein